MSPVPRDRRPSPTLEFKTLATPLLSIKLGVHCFISQGYWMRLYHCLSVIRLLLQPRLQNKWKKGNALLSIRIILLILCYLTSLVLFCIGDIISRLSKFMIILLSCKFSFFFDIILIYAIIFLLPCSRPNLFSLHTAMETIP